MNVAMLDGQVDEHFVEVEATCTFLVAVDLVASRLRMNYRRLRVLSGPCDDGQSVLTTKVCPRGCLRLEELCDVRVYLQALNGAVTGDFNFIHVLAHPSDSASTLIAEIHDSVGFLMAYRNLSHECNNADLGNALTLSRAMHERALDKDEKLVPSWLSLSPTGIKKRGLFFMYHVRGYQRVHCETLQVSSQPAPFLCPVELNFNTDKDALGSDRDLSRFLPALLGIGRSRLAAEADATHVTVTCECGLQQLLVLNQTSQCLGIFMHYIGFYEVPHVPDDVCSNSFSPLLKLCSNDAWARIFLSPGRPGSPGVCVVLTLTHTTAILSNRWTETGDFKHDTEHPVFGEGQGRETFYGSAGLGCVTCGLSCSKAELWNTLPRIPSWDTVKTESPTAEEEFTIHECEDESTVPEDGGASDKLDAYETCGDESETDIDIAGCSGSTRTVQPSLVSEQRDRTNHWQCEGCGMDDQDTSSANGHTVSFDWNLCDRMFPQANWLAPVVGVDVNLGLTWPSPGERENHVMSILCQLHAAQGHHGVSSKFSDPGLRKALYCARGMQSLCAELEQNLIANAISASAQGDAAEEAGLGRNHCCCAYCCSSQPQGVVVSL